MRFAAIIVLAAALLAATQTPGRAEDCTAQFSSEQRQVYSSLSPANQRILDTQIKNRNGEPASCDFRRGLLDILANYTADKRDADFKQLVDKMLVHTP